MHWWQNLILGIVEGLTEYLPVSSTGHLILAQRAMGIASSREADAYAICIQIGAIFAVVGLYWARIRQMLLGLIGKDPVGLRLDINVVAGFLPAAVIGGLFSHAIKEALFSLKTITAAWMVGGIAILVVTAWQKRQSAEHKSAGLPIESLTWQKALIVGLIQCLAMLPGTSRSLVTIVGGVLVGLELSAAVEFSFLLGLLTLSAAAAHDLVKDGAVMVHAYGPANLAIGFIASGLSAVVAVRWMVSYLKRRGLAVFGYYRVALALVVGTLLAMHVLEG